MPATTQGRDAKQYQFSVLSFQPEMRSGGPVERVAVIVAGEHGIFVVGGYPASLEHLSHLGQKILNELPDILVRQLEEAVGRKLDPFEWLTESNRWNLYCTPPESTESDKSIQELAFELFKKHVVQPGVTAEGFWGEVTKEAA